MVFHRRLNHDRFNKWVMVDMDLCERNENETIKEIASPFFVRIRTKIKILKEDKSMFSREMKQSFKENKGLYVGVGIGVVAVFALGVIVGSKVQYKVDMASLKKSLSTAVIFKKAVDPMFPSTMAIPEIKEALLKIDGAIFSDALVATVNGVQSIIVR